MRPLTATMLFAAALWVALTLGSVIEIYAFQHFEGAIGSRVDNLVLNVLINAAISAVGAIGFGGALRLRRVGAIPRHYILIWLPTSALVACGFVYMFMLAGIALSNLFSSWQLNIALFAGYCLLVGTIVAAALTQLLRARTRAA